MDDLSLEEQLQRLREIKKICDEIEGKYGKWDNKARDEAQKKVDEINSTQGENLIGYEDIPDMGAVAYEIVMAIKNGMSIKFSGGYLIVKGSIKYRLSALKMGSRMKPITYIIGKNLFSNLFDTGTTLGKVSIGLLAFAAVVDVAYAFSDFLFNHQSIPILVSDIVYAVLSNVLAYIFSTLGSAAIIAALTALFSPVGAFAFVLQPILGFVLSIGFLKILNLIYTNLLKSLIVASFS